MVENSPHSHETVYDFIKAYLNIIATNSIEISHKRNTLKSRVKQLSIKYKMPKDFANYLSLFLMVTKFIYIENKVWKVNESLLERLERPGFLHKNLFKFLFFTRDYNEYYKSPLVFNTIYASNDFEIINKRRSIAKTLTVFNEGEVVSFSRLYEILVKRYAFFREYNDPSSFYYTKGDVYSNRYFIFIFVFKTLQFLGIIDIDKKGKNFGDYSFHVTENGKKLVYDYFEKDSSIPKSKVAQLEKKVIEPYTVKVSQTISKDTFYLLFNQVYPQYLKNSKPNFKLPGNGNGQNHQDLLLSLRQQIIRRTQEEKIPNLLV